MPPTPPARPAEPLSGTIERVTFHSEETGFAVLRVKVKGFRELVTVVGTLADANAGEWLDAAGAWVMDPQHGRQFKAAELRTTQPDTLEGIEKYLASGLIKGIGPVYAGKLVKVFGREVLNIIENQSARLEDVEGIGPIRRARIKAAWNEQKAVREIMTFLMSHKVSTSRAFRIYKMYGDAAIERVRQDPYCLARDIHGIGFKTADQIASSLGVEPTSPLRARAGVEYVLLELTDEGHCAFPRAGLVERAAALLDIPAEILERAVNEGLETGRLVAGQDRHGEPLVYLASLDQAERQLARQMVELARGAHRCPPIDMDKALPWVQDQIRMELSPEQAEAVKLAVERKVMIITGGPGVGKTTLVNAILKILRAKKVKVVLCAPTGRAAKRMTETTGLTAKTIHRLLEYDPKTGGFRHDAAHPLSGDVFIVDETSMIDVILANQLARAVPRHAGFILVGDVDQLPSVGPGCVLRDLIDCNQFPVCRLTHIFRQAATSAIITNAHRVNAGELPFYPKERTTEGPLSDFYFIETEEPAAACDRVVSLVGEAIPKRFHIRPQDIQVITPMQRGELGARNLNLRLQAALNPRGPAIERYGWTFRVGDKVMQMENDYDKDVFNGDIGRITGLDEEERELKVRFDDREVAYDFQEMDEVSLAYATTIHKSQGSEYPCVVIPIHTQHYILLQRNLLYTAITRGRKLVIVVGTVKAMAIAAHKVESHSRVTTLKDRLLEYAGTQTD
ncbi:MAG: ATP-dependent RecD-like DNA helicase [Kiritimatiellae bacterium]|nr:ATP-dependent RecD-like DNA helicase [Kiritimatiellia bacterium]